MDFEYDPFDVEPLCVNCNYEGDFCDCLCEQRALDIKNGTEKENLSGICAYFEVADWIKNEQLQYKNQKKPIC